MKWKRRRGLREFKMEGQAREIIMDCTEERASLCEGGRDKRQQAETKTAQETQKCAGFQETIISATILAPQSGTETKNHELHPLAKEIHSNTDTFDKIHDGLPSFSVPPSKHRTLSFSARQILIPAELAHPDRSVHRAPAEQACFPHPHPLQPETHARHQP